MTQPKPVATQGKCGCSGHHPPAETLPILVAPSGSGGKGKNTLRMDLIPIACWRLNDSGFNFGSSFVVSDTKSDFDALANLYTQFPGAPLSVFGHADPVGDEAFNKTLSGHRAQSIYAILIRDAAKWESLYQSAGSSEGWGQSSIEHMLNALGYAVSAGYSDAVKRFQLQAGLTPVDGIAGPDTRASLFPAYMDYLCPRRWLKTDFLGQGSDALGKGDYQGCSEFNPFLVFSQEEEQSLSQPENQSKRNAENSVNRRVVIFLFRPGTVATPEKWPCPRGTEGTEGCIKRFWSDGGARRSPQAVRREYGDTQDTFACRFYDRLSYQSPCEGVEPTLVELVIPLEEDLDGDPDEPDCIRILQQGGGYTAELTVGDPNVIKDGTNPLYYYHFLLVPPGLYTVEVKSSAEWRTILRGLVVSVHGAIYDGESFEDETSGEEMGTPDYELVDELFYTKPQDLGCC